MKIELDKQLILEGRVGDFIGGVFNRDPKKELTAREAGQITRNGLKSGYNAIKNVTKTAAIGTNNYAKSKGYSNAGDAVVKNVAKGANVLRSKVGSLFNKSQDTKPKPKPNRNIAQRGPFSARVK